jgi:hypothetical protein
VRRAVVTALALVAGVLAAPARGGKPEPPPRHDTITLGYFSEQSGPSRAVIGAHIDVSSRRPGRSGASGRSGSTTEPVSVRTRASTPGREAPAPNLYPSLPSDSRLLRNPTPVGPGSFWYTDGSGHACMYAPSSVLPCFTVVAPPSAGASGATPLAPGAIAASVADRLPLLPGEIRRSPSARGLTGAASWFWLDPAPRSTSLSVTLARERVTVTAVPEVVAWHFGDGAALAGSVGVPYRPGPPPPEAVTHIYRTRCLPGDQGRNPYVLSSCGQNGYTVAALVSWRISFAASGPVAAAGSLPTRTTETSIVYPVTEARAFLLGGGSR